jgi:hypothetical protein
VPWIGAVLASPYISSLRSLHPFLFCSWLADPDITLSGAPQHYKLAKDPSTNMADSDSPHIMTEGQITRSAPKASQTAVLRPANQSLAFSSPLFVSSRPKIMRKKNILILNLSAEQSIKGDPRTSKLRGSLRNPRQGETR